MLGVAFICQYDNNSAKLTGDYMKLKKLLLLTLLLCSVFLPPPNTHADSCPNLQLIFIRGSGDSLNGPSFQAFKNALIPKLQTTALSYTFIDLDYPAVPIGLNNFSTSLGALVSGGESYKFGRSINAGVAQLTTHINHTTCPHTKFIIGGYSQGAMVLSKALPSLNASRIIYTATFGDPKLYLPEGKGSYPSACRNQNLSPYRVYVPDCYAHHGLLGGYKPYSPPAFKDKLGTWCNKFDLFCSSHLSLNDHLAYISDHLYEDASRMIFSKITTAFNLPKRITSPHDTAILIDSTGSMARFIDRYKAEALRLAKETLSANGRIALFEYRDLNDPFSPREHCNFSTCTLETFTTALDHITVAGGGDLPESLLSASFTAMKALRWRYGATKSLIALTDASFHSPDLDGTNFEQVVNLSHSIDPVNFYIITEPNIAPIYQPLAIATDGKVVSTTENFKLLTNFIMERFDSLPKVELSKPRALPTLQIDNFSQSSPTSTKITFTTTASKILVTLNDTILGFTTNNSITLTDLLPYQENIVGLTPISDSLRGETISIILPALTLPKAPNTSY